MGDNSPYPNNSNITRVTSLKSLIVGVADLWLSVATEKKMLGTSCFLISSAGVRIFFIFYFLHVQPNLVNVLIRFRHTKMISLYNVTSVNCAVK